MFREEVSPKLQKLREERMLYLEFQVLERELKHMVERYEAWKYYAIQKDTILAKQTLDNRLAEIQAVQDNIGKHKEAIQKIDQEVAELTSKAQAVSYF